MNRRGLYNQCENKMVFRNFHTEDVINQVKVRECLWNPRDAHYGDKFAKQHAWYEICMAVIPKFNKRPFEEQSLIAKAVQARWKTARDAFMKCINDNGKKFTYRGKSNYVHYNILTFLQKVKDYEDDSKKDPFGLIINQEDTQFEDEDAPVLSNDDDDTEDIDFNMDMNDSDANPDLPDPEVSTNVTDTVDHSEPGTSNIDNEDDSVPPPKRARKHRSPMPRGRKRKCDMSEFESKLLKILAARNESKANSVLPEDDQNFFNSLAPMLKDFNNYQKLHFRSKVLEIIREVQSVSSVKVKNEPICLEINNANSEDSDHILTESVVTFQYSSVN